MGFWKKDVVQFALSHETQAHIDEQRAWIEREPGNPRPYANLAQLYRIENRQDEALGLLLECVRLDSAFAPAHLSLSEIYAVRGDYRAAWRHARSAAASGERQGVEMLQRHGVPEIL